MLSAEKLKKVCRAKKVGPGQLAAHLTAGDMDGGSALTAARNWLKGLYNPQPGRRDVEKLAAALGVEVNDISQWRAIFRYAPMSASKVRLVTGMLAGREVQDAIDILNFTRKRAAEAVRKTIQCAVANADEQEADVDQLVITEIRVDGAGRRLGTKQWRAKDRGRAHSIRKEASHIHVTVAEA